MAHFLPKQRHKNPNSFCLKESQVQVELEDSINIAYGILENIFQILNTENGPVKQIIPCLAIISKKVKTTLPTSSKNPYFCKKN